jgi:hypothetical protein
LREFVEQSLSSQSRHTKRKRAPDGDPLSFGAPGRIVRPLCRLTPQGGRSLASLAAHSLG